MSTLTAESPATHVVRAAAALPLPKEPALLHEFFERAVRRWPNHIAIEVPPSSRRAERRSITYADLNQQADALAQFVRDFVQQADCIVAILLPRDSVHLHLAQLAALKAGAAYTCIDPIFPDEQVYQILEDSQAVAVLTDDFGSMRVRDADPDTECVLNVIDWLEQYDDAMDALPPPEWLTPQSLAYLIYTSGTTGRPKGVMIEHGSIANLVRGDLAELDVVPSDRVAQSSSCAYDSSVEETWFALAAGATLVLMDDETARLGPDLVPWLRDERISMFCPPPTLLRSTGCGNPERELPHLRLVYVGGEALPQDVAERWSRGRRLVNGYGPTETTVTALRGLIEPGNAVTIGRPVPGMQAWVLDESLAEVAAGVQGELCLGGIGLARGYRHLPDLTAQKFFEHPRLGRIYRTGDLVQRDARGNFFCHGRIDSQVKLRGYRIELEAIETRLIECAGVRAAACGVQGDGAQNRLVAFIVPHDGAQPPAVERLKEQLRQVLPEYMVPARFGIVAQLPTSVGGKLDRKALPVLESHEGQGDLVAPRSAIEEKIAAAFHLTLEMTEPVSVDQDFFNDLGGDSLLAACLISRLRDDPVTAALTVRDLYETRTVAELAKRVGTAGGARAALAEDPARPGGHPFLATTVQTLWLLAGLMLAAPVAYLVAFHALPFALENVGLVGTLLLAPLLYFGGLFIYTPLAVGMAVLAKKLLIGRYRPLREPVWGSFYVRNWMVQQVVRLVPWRLFEGTVWQHMVLRALGARIGRRVHIHRGVNLVQGGWDLLDIGNDVTLSQDSSVNLVELEDGQIVVGPITLGNGTTLDIRAGVSNTTCIEDEGFLTALSLLPRGGRIPRGERWCGVPAQPAGHAPPTPTSLDDARVMSPLGHSLALLAGRMALGAFLALPFLALALAFAAYIGVTADNTVAWIFNPVVDAGTLLVCLALVTLTVPLTLAAEALAMRLMGRLTPGVLSLWSPAYVRIWLKAGVLDAANRWLSGTLFWPVWLRWAGMRIGKGCEISTIVDTMPELVTIGAETFFADGIYLAGPRLHRGTVTLARVTLGRNTFLGNHVVIAAGQNLPDDILLGICTVADDKIIRPGTSWFGHPPFELPKREVVECARSLTHEPSWPRYLSRVFWELLRFPIPVVPTLLVLAWFSVMAAAQATLSLAVVLLVVAPLLELAVGAFLCVLVLALKWFLLGRVRPGMHPLWSCWCSRWDFLYVAWDFYGRGPLSALEGTLLLNAYLRVVGMRIGRNVVLGGGFSQVVDPDMLEFEDGATVTCMFQAHTFEDRVLKIDHVKIRRQATAGDSAVLLYGADIGVRTYVMPHSVVMKRERLLSGRSYAGCPTHLFQ